MQDVPKIVQARLRRMTTDAAEAHPDTDLLTAFAEQALSDSERAHVMEHLARCGDCRDVLALALPATEDMVGSGPETSVRGRWFAWPGVRWGVVAAGVLLVTAVGVIQYKQRAQQNVALVSGPASSEEKIATTFSSPQPSSETPAAQAPHTTEMAKQIPTGKPPRPQAPPTAEQPGASLNTLSPPPRAMDGAVSSGAIGGRVTSGVGSGYGRSVHQNYQGQAPPDSSAFTLESKIAGAAPSRQAAIPPSSQTVAVQSEAVQVEVAQNQGELPAQKAPSATLDVVKAKDSVTPQAAPTVPAPNVALQTDPALMLRASPRWTISSTGGLQRSFDAGKTWEDVRISEDVDARSASLARSSQNQSVAEYKDENKSKDRGAKKAAEAQPALVFRAVAAVGPEVWAGGSVAMLYHSADSGTHWTRVTPSAGGAALAGDVISIQFADANHGIVITSNSERWSTSDAGQTWQKQP